MIKYALSILLPLFLFLSGCSHISVEHFDNHEMNKTVIKGARMVTIYDRGADPIFLKIEE